MENSGVQNFYNDDVYILNSSSILNNRIIEIDTISIKSCSTTENLVLSEIKGSFFDFLTNQILVNDSRELDKLLMEAEAQVDKDSLLSRLKKDIKLFSLGRIELDTHFFSFLILHKNISNDLYQSIQYLYLLNVDSNNKVRSLTEVADSFTIDGVSGSSFSLISANRNIMRYGNRIKDGDLPLNIGTKEKYNSTITFSFGKDGCVDLIKGLN